MTDKIRIRAVVIIVVLQMLFFAGWYAMQSGALKTPTAKIMVKTQPYDPRDLISGQYIRLNYSFSNASGRWDSKLKKTIYPKWSQEIKNVYSRKNAKKQIWVILHEVDGFYEPKSASFEQPQNLEQGEVLIKGKRKRGRILYGIERYFVPEGTKEPKPENTTVELNMYKNGLAHINQVFVDGKKWP